MSAGPGATPAGLTAAVDGRYGRLASSTAGSLSCGPALDLAALAPGERVVDLGCGRGGDLLRAADRVGASGRVTGVDGSPRMVEAARERTAARPNVAVRLGDLAGVPLPDGSADVVISNCAINHAPDKGAVYREIRRLLAPAGRAVVSDVLAEAALPEAVRSDPAAWAGCYGGAIPEADYLAAVRSAGLDVAVLRRTAPYEKGGVRVFSVTLEARPSPAP